MDEVKSAPVTKKELAFDDYLSADASKMSKGDLEKAVEGLRTEIGRLKTLTQGGQGKRKSKGISSASVEVVGR